MGEGAEAPQDPASLLPAEIVVPPSYVVQALEDRYIRATVLIAALESLWPGKWEVVVGALSVFLQPTCVPIENKFEYTVFVARLVVEVLRTSRELKEADHPATDEVIFPHCDFATGAHEGRHLNSSILIIDRKSC
jgi:hypothetical protein